MKYELTRGTIIVSGTKLHRIKALKDFGDVKKGELGGWIKSTKNLSQKGDCWVYSDAGVSDDARIYENAKIYNYALVSGNAKIYRNAKICGSARIYENARVYDNAMVCGKAKVYENARVYGNATVNHDVKVYRNAKVAGNARVHGDAEVYENAIVCGDAIICENHKISNCTAVTDLTKNLKESIRCQTSLGVFNNKVIAYKQVEKDLKSFHDSDFQYVVGEYAIAENYDDSNESCASGLHFSNMNYWNEHEGVTKSTFLMAEIDLDDIITVQEGKIRCKQAKILGKYDIE